MKVPRGSQGYRRLEQVNSSVQRKCDLPRRRLSPPRHYTGSRAQRSLYYAAQVGRLTTREDRFAAIHALQLDQPALEFGV